MEDFRPSKFNLSDKEYKYLRLYYLTCIKWSMFDLPFFFYTYNYQVAEDYRQLLLHRREEVWKFLQTKKIGYYMSDYGKIFKAVDVKVKKANIQDRAERERYRERMMNSILPKTEFPKSIVWFNYLYVYCEYGWRKRIGDKEGFHEAIKGWLENRHRKCREWKAGYYTHDLLKPFLD